MKSDNEIRRIEDDVFPLDRGDSEFEPSEIEGKNVSEGGCPLCGGNLEYDSAKIEDNNVFNPWICADCGASGDECYDMKFAGYFNVRDGNGVEVEVVFFAEDAEKDSAPEAGS